MNDRDYHGPVVGAALVIKVTTRAETVSALRSEGLRATPQPDSGLGATL
jgi:hypothetical protein